MSKTLNLKRLRERHALVPAQLVTACVIYITKPATAHYPSLLSNTHTPPAASCLLLLLLLLPAAAALWLLLAAPLSSTA